MMRFKRSLPGIFIICLMVIVFLVVLYRKTTFKTLTNRSDQAQQPTIQPEKSEVHSSDGTATLIMKTQMREDQLKTYSFFVANLSGGNKTERLLFTRTFAPTREISIPQNSWSPDNKYVFLQEKDASGQTNFLVLKASGELFADGEKYLDVVNLFNKSKIEYLLRDATGWAAPTFLNITTNKNDAEKGPSYWLDVDSRSFLMHQ